MTFFRRCTRGVRVFTGEQHTSRWDLTKTTGGAVLSESGFLRRNITVMFQWLSAKINETANPLMLSHWTTPRAMIAMVRKYYSQGVPKSRFTASRWVERAPANVRSTSIRAWIGKRKPDLPERSNPLILIIVSFSLRRRGALRGLKRPRAARLDVSVELVTRNQL
jgi:hypothetical protein